MEALACSLPPSHVVWSCGWQEFMAKARAAMFFPTLSMLFFPHGCSFTRRRRARWSRGGVPVNHHLPERERGMTDVSAVLLASSIQGTQSLIYRDLLLYLLSQLQYTHRQLKLQTVVKHRQPFHSHYSMHNYTVFWGKTRFNSASGSNVLGAGLGLVGPLYCLANLKVLLVKLWWLNVPW